MLTAAALAFVNHLLASETWAMARLQPFAGRTARLCCPPFDICVQIDETGALSIVSDAVRESVDASLSLAPESLATLAAAWRQSGNAGHSGIPLFAVVHVEGAADLAETLAFVLRNLHWDVEDDLARCVGDIAARRLGQCSRAALAGASQAAWNLAQNFAEYFSAEKSLIIRQADVAAFTRRADALAAEAARLEQRLMQLDTVSRGQ